MKTTVIVGSEGQDGTILSGQLVSMGYAVIGIDRDILKSTHDIAFAAIAIDDKEQVNQFMKVTKPDELYYLAAYHHSSEDEPTGDYELFQQSYQVNLFSLINFLEAIKDNALKTRLFYASSSLIFGNADTVVQDERTPFRPDSIYGFTKCDGLLACRYYRENYGIFASAGILYNHESEYRTENFLSKKIINAAINIKNNKQDKLFLGDLSAEIDWGYAPDYTDAMYKILKLEYSDDFIIATGMKHSVRDFVSIAFDYLELDWKKYVEEDKSIVIRKRHVLIGNPGKLTKATGWRPSVDFEGMIRIMLNKMGAICDSQ